MGPKSRVVKFYSTVSDRPEVIHLISRLFGGDGGPGSGNHGHAGRPGKRGGSAPGKGGNSSGSGSKKQRVVKTALQTNGIESSESLSELKSLERDIVSSLEKLELKGDREIAEGELEKVREKIKEKTEEEKNGVEEPRPKNGYNLHEQVNKIALQNLREREKLLNNVIAENGSRTAYTQELKEIREKIREIEGGQDTPSAIKERIKDKEAEIAKFEEKFNEIDDKFNKNFEDLHKARKSGDVEKVKELTENVYNLSKEKSDAIEEKRVVERDIKELKEDLKSALRRERIAELRKRFDESENQTPEDAENLLIELQEEYDRNVEKGNKLAEEVQKNAKNLQEAFERGDEEAVRKYTDNRDKLHSELMEIANKNMKISSDKVELEKKLHDMTHPAEEGEKKRTVGDIDDEIELRQEDYKDAKREARMTWDEVLELQEKVKKLQNEEKYDEADKVEEQYYEKKAEYDGLNWEANQIQNRIRELEQEKSELKKEEETKEIEASGLSEPEFRRKKAEEIFGYTDDYNEAGWILPNGEMLNFSGEKDYHPGERGLDHREIARVYADTDDYDTSSMRDFRNDGNVRLYPEVPGVNIAAVGNDLTEEQYETIRNIIDKINDEGRGEFCVDFSSSYGDMYGQLAYSTDPDYGENAQYTGEYIDADEVIRDIREHLQTGEITEEFGKATFNGDSKPNTLAEDGGPGSGNHNHAGRPGKRGGSAPNKSGSGRTIDPDGGPDNSTEIEFLKKKISKMSRFGTEGESRRVFEKLLEKLESEAEHNALEEKGQKVSQSIEAQKVSYSTPPRDAVTLKTFSEYSKKRNKDIIDSSGVNREDVKKATETLTEIFNRNEFGMFIDPEDFLNGVVNSHFKNQFETRKSRGLLDPTTREDASRKLFGTDIFGDIKPENYEKYGALVTGPTGKGCTSGWGYGKLAVTFKKDRLAGKVTYTIGDSLTNVTGGNHPYMAAGSVSVGKTTFGGSENLAVDVEFLKNLPKEQCGDLMYIKSQLTSPYIELQYHGELTADDVATMCFKTENDLYRYLSPEQEKDLKSKGIKIGYMGGALNDEYIEI